MKSLPEVEFNWLLIIYFRNIQFAFQQSSRFYMMMRKLSIPNQLALEKASGQTQGQTQPLRF